jgi:hypothetical protein
MRLFLALTALALGACNHSSYDLDGGDLITVGKAYAQQRLCLDCHGANLAGSTTARADSMAYPSNLTPDGETGIGNWADVTVIRAIRFGVDDEQQPLCPTMPPFTNMTDLEARAIVAYLRSVPPVHQAIPESMCPPVKPIPPLDMTATAAPDDLSMSVPVDGGVSD